VKISDGCDRFCSYCTIPYIRGRYHSFPYEQIAEDVEREIASGAREIVLIAQDTGRWGADLPDGRDLAWLVDTLAEAHRKAVNTAAYVCTANGAWPEYPDTMPDYLAQAAQ